MKKILLLVILLFLFIFGFNKVRDNRDNISDNYVVNEALIIENPDVSDPLFNGVVGVVISLSVLTILGVYIKIQYNNIF